MSLVFASALARSVGPPVTGSRRIAPGVGVAKSPHSRARAPSVTAHAKKKGGSRDSYEDYDDGFGSGSGNYDANFNSIDDDFGAASDYDSFGSPTKSGQTAGGKKKGAAKRPKKTKAGDDGLGPVAGDVSRLIRSNAPAKPESGAIGSSLDSGDGPNFVKPLDGWKKKGEGSAYGDVFDNSAAFSWTTEIWTLANRSSRTRLGS